MHLRPVIKKILNYVVGPALFAAIGWSIYRQVSAHPSAGLQWDHIQQIFQYKNKLLLYAACGLMMLNWGLEAKKWQILTSHVQPTPFFTALRSVMAGVSFTMLTPNRMGEFLGRVLYLPDGSRIRAATLMVLSSTSQLVITLLAGTLSMWLLKEALSTIPDEWAGLLFHSILFGSLAFMVVCLLVFFNIGWFIRQIERIPPFSKYAYYIHVIGEIHYRELIKLLGLSLVRYSVFLLQYILVFRFFETGIEVHNILTGTSVLFLMLAIIPTIALAELGVRGQVSLYIFGLFSDAGLEILIATAVIWIINIIFPAIAGSFLLLTVKLFKKTE